MTRERLFTSNGRASGNPSEMASRTTLGRFVEGGIIPVTSNAVLAEMRRTWNWATDKNN